MEGSVKLGRTEAATVNDAVEDVECRIMLSWGYSLLVVIRTIVGGIIIIFRKVGRIAPMITAARRGGIGIIVIVTSIFALTLTVAAIVVGNAALSLPLFPPFQLTLRQ
eukprot:scaffold13560_cov122-Alexandrium_tamarense.AAC.10